jgi:hypothetical protein
MKVLLSEKQNSKRQRTSPAFGKVGQPAEENKRKSARPASGEAGKQQDKKEAELDMFSLFFT